MDIMNMFVDWGGTLGGVMEWVGLLVLVADVIVALLRLARERGRDAASRTVTKYVIVACMAACLILGALLVRCGGRYLNKDECFVVEVGARNCGVDGEWGSVATARIGDEVELMAHASW